MVEDHLASLGASTASSLHRKMISLSNSVNIGKCLVRKRIGIETPHILEKPLVIESTEYQSQIVHKSDDVGQKAASRELAPYRCLASSRLNILHLLEMDHVKPWRWIEERGAGRLRYSGEVRHRAWVGVGRRQAAPFVGELLGGAARGRLSALGTR